MSVTDALRARVQEEATVDMCAPPPVGGSQRCDPSPGQSC